MPVITDLQLFDFALEKYTHAPETVEFDECKRFRKVFLQRSTGWLETAKRHFNTPTEIDLAYIKANDSKMTILLINYLLLLESKMEWNHSDSN